MTSTQRLKALVIGGGIGGLATAVALRGMNVEPLVFEASHSIEEAGAGLTLWPNAVRALRRIGVESTLDAVSLPIKSLRLQDSHGAVLAEQRLADIERRFGAPLLGVHRASLLAALLHELGERHVVLGRRLAGFDQDGEGVTARFEDGAHERGDLLVGADGIHSTVRAQLLPSAAPRYSGQAAWRGVAVFQDARLPAGVGFESWGRGSRFGAIHIGLRRVYWFATANLPERASDTPTGRKQELLDRFRGWHEPVEALLQATPEGGILRNDLYDLPPLERWSVGRVTLLGDAAHAATPNLGQGAGMALEDAVVLATAVRDARGDVPAGLRSYETQRLERTRRVTELSLRLGKLAALENPVLARLRNTVTRATPAALQLRQLDWLLAYEP